MEDSTSSMGRMNQLEEDFVKEFSMVQAELDRAVASPTTTTTTTTSGTSNWKPAAPMEDNVDSEDESEEDLRNYTTRATQPNLQRNNSGYSIPRAADVRAAAASAAASAASVEPASSEEEDSLFWANEDDTLANLGDSFTLSGDDDHDLLLAPSSSLPSPGSGGGGGARMTTRTPGGGTGNNSSGSLNLASLPLMGSGDYHTSSSDDEAELWEDDERNPNNKRRGERISDVSLTMAEALPNWKSSDDDSETPSWLQPSLQSQSRQTNRSKPTAAAFGTPDTVRSSNSSCVGNGHNSRTAPKKIHPLLGTSMDSTHHNDDPLMPSLMGDNSHSNQQEDARWKERLSHSKCFLGLAACLCALAMAAAIVLPIVFLVILPNNDNRNDNVNTTSATPLTIAPTQPSDQQQLLALFPTYTRQAIQDDPDSPQARAYDWIRADDPTFFNTTTTSNSDGEERKDRLRQRFALATLFFALDQSNSTTLECDWLTNDNNKDACRNGVTDTIAINSTMGAMNQSISDGFNGSSSIPTSLSPLEETKTANIFQQNNKAGPPQRLRRGRRNLQQDAQQQQQGLFQKTQHLRFPDRNLSGSIPPEIALLSDLITIDFSSNTIRGSFPVEATMTMSNLESLNLTNNLLTGSMTTHIGTLGALHHLDLSHNQINSTLPTQLGDLKQLQTLEVEQNAFTGSIPTTLEKLLVANGGALQRATFANNNLSGVVPEGLCSLLPMLQFDCATGALCGCDCTCSNANTTEVDIISDAAAAAAASEAPTEFDMDSLDAPVDTDNNLVSTQAPTLSSTNVGDVATEVPTVEDSITAAPTNQTVTNVTLAVTEAPLTTSEGPGIANTSTIIPFDGSSTNIDAANGTISSEPGTSVTSENQNATSTNRTVG